MARNTEMRLSVRQIRLSFPLRLVVDDVMVSTPVLDTMAYCTRLEADVACGRCCAAKSSYIVSGSTGRR